jgi:hypothetical protein
MSEILLSRADSIYRCVRNLTLEYHNIQYPELQTYSNFLRKFFISLGDVRLDSYWREKKWDLRRIAFLLCGAPLSKSYLTQEISRITKFLGGGIDSCKKLYPAHGEAFAELILTANSLLDSNLEKIKSEVEGITNNSSGTIAILIKDTKLIPFIEHNFTGLSGLQVKIIGISALKKDICFDNLIVIGTASPKWYPDFVFSSPRTRSIHVIKMHWMSGTWKPANSFPNSIKSKSLPRMINEEEDLSFGEEVIDPEFVLPTLDFSQLIQTAKQEFSNSDDETEFIDAVIAYLENDQIVFLDNDESSSVRVLERDDESNPIKRLRVRELEKEMFILLRTSGGGDYIVPIANRIMGDVAEKARELQKEWKNGLRRIVRIKGMDWTVRELKSLGCRIADPGNVRNWMSYRSIKTNSYSDFLSIMILVGLETSSQEVWKHMKGVSRAHIKAGHEIARLLLNVVKTTDYDDLLRLGIQEYELPDRDAGQITAFRIKFISEETIKVPESKIYILLDPESYG